MIISALYVCSAIIAICVVFFSPKSLDKQEGSIWLPICYVTYECGISLVASVCTIIHIPVNLITLCMINLLVGLVGFFWIRKKGEMQRYCFQIENAVFILMLAVIVIFVAYERYGKGFAICFETSDPATHLKLAMDTVNNQSVISQTMYVAPFTNGIFIRMLLPIFDGLDVYKSFIIKEVFNLWLSGAVFYSCICKLTKNKFGKLFGMIITMVYFLGYPYNNMIFGFSYLGLGVTIISFLIFITNLYLESHEENKVLLFMLSLGCFGIAGCYTLFAPAVFVAIFICIAYKYKHLYGGILFYKQFYLKELQVFFMPTILTAWYTIIYPRIVDNGAMIEYGSALNIEGYIYRNLYSDFIIYLPVAVYAVFINLFKKKERLITPVLFVIFIMYCTVFFIGMYLGKVSTYYYYKLNFVIWLLVLILFADGIYHLASNCKEMAVIYCGCWGIVFLLWFFRIDINLYNKNISMNPFPNSTCFFEIYENNRIMRERRTTISEGLVDLCREFNENYKNDAQVTMYLGNWLNNYWYEALTNQRQNGAYAYYNPLYFTQNFMDGVYGKYLVVAKNDESLTECYLLIQNLKVVYENEYGYIMERE